MIWREEKNDEATKIILLSKLCTESERTAVRSDRCLASTSIRSIFLALSSRSSCSRCAFNLKAVNVDLNKDNRQDTHFSALSASAASRSASFFCGEKVINIHVDLMMFSSIYLFKRHFSSTCHSNFYLKTQYKIVSKQEKKFNWFLCRKYFMIFRRGWVWPREINNRFMMMWWINH